MDIGGPLQSFFWVDFGPLRNGSLRRFSLGDTKHLTPIEATIVSRVDLHGCPILSPRMYESGENKRPPLQVERQCSLDICELFMAISSHDEPRACFISNSTRLRGINNRRKDRTNSRTTFSMSGFVGRKEIATADIADTSETASLLSVHVCEKMGESGIFPPFGTWQAARPRPVRLASARVRTKWSNESATMWLSCSHYVVVLQAWWPMTWL